MKFRLLKNSKDSNSFRNAVKSHSLNTDAAQKLAFLIKAKTFFNAGGPPSMVEEADTVLVDSIGAGVEAKEKSFSDFSGLNHSPSWVNRIARNEVPMSRSIWRDIRPILCFTSVFCVQTVSSDHQ
jgi:hypothetical protein